MSPLPARITIKSTGSMGENINALSKMISLNYTTNQQSTQRSGMRRDSMRNGVLLKYKLCKEIFGFLTIIIKKNSHCQKAAFNFLDCYIKHLKLIPQSLKFIGELFSSDKDFASTLDKNFNIDLLSAQMPDSQEWIIDVVVKDPNNDLVQNLHKIQTSVAIENAITKINTRPMNLILLGANWLKKYNDNYSQNYKVLELFSKLCIVNNKPYKLTQDLIYRVFEMKEVEESGFVEFKVLDNEIMIRPIDQSQPMLTLAEMKFSMDKIYLRYVKHNFDLFANLSENRNVYWKSYLTNLLPREFLGKQIWNNGYFIYKKSLYKLLINLYINQEPFHKKIYPSPFQVINEKHCEHPSEQKMTRTQIDNENPEMHLWYGELIDNLASSLKSDCQKFHLDFERITMAGFDQPAARCKEDERKINNLISKKYKFIEN
jgi:hypothetical protein